MGFQGDLTYAVNVGGTYACTMGFQSFYGIQTCAEDFGEGYECAIGFQGEYTSTVYVGGGYACAMDFRVSRVIKHAQQITHAQWVSRVFHIRSRCKWGLRMRNGFLE